MSTIDNINGIYAKDTELRNGISELRGDILSQTIKPLSIIKNGTYTAIPSSGTYGYSPVTVDVQEEPWQPLEDGYSNFWFNLTDDTLSPWLNFSAKNANAVIDWGDGSGEQSLDTLTPTHTYSKAGKYVVKVKGVTGIAQQYTVPYGAYNRIIKSIEFANEVTSLSVNCFRYCIMLKNVSFGTGIIEIPTQCFQNCVNIEKLVIPSNVVEIGNNGFTSPMSLNDLQLNEGLTTINNNAFVTCAFLRSIRIPSTVTSIGTNAFAAAVSLSEIHIAATVPPSVVTNSFTNMPSNYVMYVPVGYGETYKAASGWSTYADHILEEGETPTRAMMAKFNSNNTDNEEMR